MENKKHEMKNVNSLFWKSDAQIVVKYMSAYFLKITSRTQETEKVCSWTYLLENNQVRQSVKFIISSM